MGVRGELFSTRVALQNRTYFFNVKENRLGDLYLNIVESKNRDEGGFERQSVILFADDLQDFLQGFEESLRVLEKAAREKRKGASDKRPRPAAVHGMPDEDFSGANESRRGARNTDLEIKPDTRPGARLSARPGARPGKSASSPRREGPGREGSRRDGPGRDNAGRNSPGQFHDAYKGEAHKDRDKPPAPRKRRVVVRKY